MIIFTLSKDVWQRMDSLCFLMFGDREKSFKTKASPWWYSCFTQDGLWGKRLQAEKQPQSHTRRRNPARRWKWKGRKGLMVGLVNAPLGFLQAETSTNISIITEKPCDCQAQSPDVVDNMFELLVVKVSSCSSNTDKTLHCQIPVTFSTTGCSRFLTGMSCFLSPQLRQDNIRRPEGCKSCFSLKLPSSA